MTDISKCAGIDCPIRETCYRFTAPADPYRQSWMVVRYVDPCEYRMPVWPRGAPSQPPEGDRK